MKPDAYVISYSAIFKMAFNQPWVVQREGSADCWTFATEKAAMAFVAAQENGYLAAVHKHEERTYKRWKGEAA